MGAASMKWPLSEFLCSICKDFFTDPVTITCGHSFCTPCLCLFWEGTPILTCCPVCRRASKKIDFRSTILAQKQVLPPGETVFCQFLDSAKHICKTHQTMKTFFCPADKSLLCLLCCYSPEHVTHGHCPVRQAAEHCRETILVQMKSIWKNKQKNQRNLNRESSIFKGWKGIVILRMMMIRAEYPKVCQYLHEEQQKHFESLEMEGKMIFQQLRTNVTRMLYTRKALTRLYEQLKKLCCKADMDLLQDSRDMMIRAQIVQMYMPQPVDPQFTTWTITGMSERLNNFRVYITLDHRKRKYDIPLFEELRHLQRSSDHQETSHNPANLEYTTSWGAQTFTSGRHYWEMNMGNSDLSFAMDTNHQKQVTNLTKVLGIPIADEACILVTS